MHVCLDKFSLFGYIKAWDKIFPTLIIITNQIQIMKKEYQSQDFYLCAYLMSSGVRLKSYHKKNQSTVFVFD